MKSIYLRGLILGLSLFALAAVAEARLGDSLETLDKKHGEGKVLPSEKGLQLKIYQNEGLDILVYFKNRRSAKEVYSKTAGGNGSAADVFIAPEIFQALLKANNAGKLWLPLDEKGEVSSQEEPARIKGELGDYSVLAREDQQAVAQLFFKGDKIITIVISEVSLAGSR